jgi:hypothetical protein
MRRAAIRRRMEQERVGTPVQPSPDQERAGTPVQPSPDRRRVPDHFADIWGLLGQEGNLLPAFPIATTPCTPFPRVPQSNCDIPDPAIINTAPIAVQLPSRGSRNRSGRHALHPASTNQQLPIPQHRPAIDDDTGSDLTKISDQSENHRQLAPESPVVEPQGRRVAQSSQPSRRGRGRKRK